MSAFFVQKTSEEHLASLKSPSRQNPQIQETNFGNSVSCNGYAENGFKMCIRDRPMIIMIRISIGIFIPVEGL